jgi:wyosine [tRNA(Phe)-imidazoG37] synthetase (radical SAM superfamily)
VLLVKGLNDSPASLGALARLARTLRLEAVDLNTVVRPPPAGGVEGLDRQELERALACFEGCPAEIIVPYEGAPSSSTSKGSLGQIRALVARRPCTAEDLCAALGLSPHLVRTLCGEAVARGLLRSRQRDGATYFLPGAPGG